MEESTNPIFDSEREFLERQQEEYRNALLGNVEEIKNRSAQIGKIALIAGGVLAGTYVAAKLIRSGRNGKDNPYYLSDRKAQRRRSGRSGYSLDYVGSYEDEVYDDEPRRREEQDTSVAKSFVQSDLFKMISHQVSALLLVLLTRKLEEYMGVHAFRKEEPRQEEETSVVIIEEETRISPDITYSDQDAR
jgi:hypothetical protein